MSISETSDGPSPADLIAATVAALRDLLEVLWPARSDEELVAVVGGIQELSAVAAVVEAGALVEVDERDIARQQLHFASTADWLTHIAGIRRGEGKRRLERARALEGGMARTREGLAQGMVSPVQADLIVEAVEGLPPGELVRRRGERLMVEQAAHLDATDLARAGRHLVDVVDPDGAEQKLEAQLEREERAAHLDRFLSVSQDRAGGVRIKGRGSAEDGALIKAALLPLTKPAPAVDEVDGAAVRRAPDPRDHGARLWDAWVTIAEHALSSERVPESHAVPARLLVTVDQASLGSGKGHPLSSPSVAVTNEGTELPAGVLRRMACDAEIVPAVLGTRSEVLDVGRVRRLVTPAIWTALVLRDRHCSFPACTRPPVMCHAHHLTHWADGGETKLDNLALLCGHHHRTIHDTPWQIRLDQVDRRPEFRAPPKPGVTPAWIRHRPRRC